MTNLEQAVKSLQDNLIVIAEIERRQSVIPEHSERMVQIDERLDRISVKLEGLTVKVDEIADKLNGLIGYVAGIKPQPPPN